MSQFDYEFAGMVLNVDVTFNRVGKYCGVMEYDIEMIDIMHENVEIDASELWVKDGEKFCTLKEMICDYATEHMGDIL